MKYPTFTPSELVAALEPPEGRVRMVLDTDTYNEIDDQFAVVHALTSDMDVEAIYAAPFHNARSEGPEDGMEKSYPWLSCRRGGTAGFGCCAGLGGTSACR